MSSEPQGHEVPGQRPPQAAMPAPGSVHLTVENNDRSSIMVAAGNITLLAKPPLQARDIPAQQLRAVREAWVNYSWDNTPLSVAGEAEAHLLDPDAALAVVCGPEGFGKRAAGIRALWKAATRPGRPPLARSPGATELKEILTDWNSPTDPDLSVLPAEPGVGYLLDVSEEISGWTDPVRASSDLIAHAQSLSTKGSFLVVIADDRSWPVTESGPHAAVVARATHRPHALQLARAHLKFLHRKADRDAWLSRTNQTDDNAQTSAAHLLRRTSSPEHAARLAELLARAPLSPQGLLAAIAAFEEWHDQVADVFAATEQNADDRALLIASLFLDGSDVLDAQKAARMLLNEKPPKNVRAILSGPDLTTRLKQVGVNAEDRRILLADKPGYARSVLLHLWRQRPDIHVPLLKWLTDLTAPKGPGAGRLDAIGDLLHDLAVAERDIRALDKLREWITDDDSRLAQRELVARVMARAAEADGVGAAVRDRLLTWSQEPAVGIAHTVALVCRTSFAEHFPRQTLFRLRHILDRPERDEAVQTAEQALRSFAALDGQLPRVSSAVFGWAKQHQHLAGHRAFLALLDPTTDAYALRVLLAAAEGKPEVKQALVEAWISVLGNPAVHAQATGVLIAWARSRLQDPLIPGELILDVMREVVDRHLMATPISALVFGEADVCYDAAVIDLRKQLRLPSPDAFTTSVSQKA
ncbi:hypothetical protein [Streptomyces sp. NPDC058374]|uniref:hypothetical protein n=1 Tax=Streptomyces sp. NPDC058374 TaxID=3346466 RepID=UPI003657D6E1